MKSLLIHIGSDQTSWSTLGVNAPVFDDGTFEFIPIAESLTDGTCIVKRGDQFVPICDEKDSEEQLWTSENRIYSEIETRNKTFGKKLSDYLPREYENVVVHLDPDFEHPDFEHYTYGDRVDTSKGTQISKLKRGDYIFFVSSLAPYFKNAYQRRDGGSIRSAQRGQMAKFLVGYFKVNEVYYALKAYDESEPLLYRPDAEADDPINSKIDNATLVQIMNNAHTKRDDDAYFIIVGDQSDSALFTKAIRITKKAFPFRASEIGKEIFGDINYPRGIKWIYDPKRIQILLNYINELGLS